MVSHVKFVSIPVSDQDRALRFYRDKLGFEVITDAPFSEGVRWIEVRPPDGRTGLVLFPSTEEFPIPCPALVFAVEDVRATHWELGEKGVEFSKPPYEEPHGVFAHLIDPDGNEFVLASPD